VKSLSIVLWMAGLIFLSSCGGGSSQLTGSSGESAAGNWQFAMTPPSDNPAGTPYGLQGGFLLQKQGSVSGSATYSVSSAASVPPCNSGSAVVTGTISGQNVSYTAVAGTQTFNLTGTLTADGTTIMGTYSATAGTASGGNACGSAQSGLPWQATLIPPINGGVQGSLHSTAGGLLQDQNFQVSGTLAQGQNTGLSNSTVTGSLVFQDYPCLDAGQTISVNGTISGNSLILQLFSDKGLNIGQIGAAANSTSPGPVTLKKQASGGYLVQGNGGYVISTKSCNQQDNPYLSDSGNICLALNNATDCGQPLTVTPGVLAFPMQLVGSTPTTQSITITNTDPAGSTLTGLSLAWNPEAGYTSPYSTLSDFNALPNFTEKDTCSTTPGATFSLAPQQSCVASVSFSPQQSCTWLPTTINGGVIPAQCPPDLTSTITTPPGLSARLSVNVPTSEGNGSIDNDTAFSVLINGVGVSAVLPSTPELDFGSVAPSESSAPQTISLINQGTQPVQILPKASKPCVNPAKGSVTYPNPVHAGDVDGVQIIQAIQAIILDNGNNSILYLCDQDQVSGLPDFQISANSCLGTVLAPQQSCSLTVTYVPQPSLPAGTILDFFLQLNTQQCTPGGSQLYCEIDSGRLPVELKTSAPSPLRLTPGAGLDFGPQPKGVPTLPLTVTLYNDPKDPNAAAIDFKGDVLKGDYIETDNCGSSLAPGNSCTLNIVFSPKSTGYDPGTLTITYQASTFLGPQAQVIYLRGSGQ